MAIPMWSSILINFFWYDASSPVDRLGPHIIISLRSKDGGEGTDLESEEDDVGLAAKAYAGRSLLDCLEGVLDLRGPRQLGGRSCGPRERTWCRRPAGLKTVWSESYEFLCILGGRGGEGEGKEEEEWKVGRA